MCPVAYTFARIVKEEKWLKQLPKKAMRFVETEKTERLYLGKKVRACRAGPKAALLTINYYPFTINLLSELINSNGKSKGLYTSYPIFRITLS